MSVIVTTSWDDGHVLDLRIAELLDRYGLTGTFYITRDFLDERMSESQLRELAQCHEIGAHTLTHPTLTTISLVQARDEIRGSKHWLEDVLGHEVKAFCYPKGANNLDLQALVAEAGYLMARTVDKFALSTGKNVYAVPTTLQIYPYPLRPLNEIAWWRGWRTRLQPLAEVMPTVRKFQLSPMTLFNWQTLAEAFFKQAEVQGGIWHLWGHSWEIERYGLWDALDKVLRTISRDTTVRPLPNSRTIEKF